MNASTLFSVAPTFPLDDSKIRQISRQKIWNSPITIGVTTCSIIIGIYISPWALPVCLGLSTLGLLKYWSRRKSELDAESMMEVIKLSNQDQNKEMQRIIYVLDGQGKHQYSLCLGRFLRLKQRIESSLHSKELLKPYAGEIETLIDGICEEVCREITHICEKEKSLGDVLTSHNESRLEKFESERRDMYAAVLHAYTSLYQTHSSLTNLEKNDLSPEKSQKSGTRNTQKLRQMVADLRDESDFIKRLNTRVSESLMEEEDSQVAHSNSSASS